MSLTTQDLQNIATLFDARFDRIDARLAAIDERFDAIDERFSQLEQRVERFRIETAEEFRAIDKRFVRIEQRLDAHDAQFEWVRSEFKAVRTDLRYIREVCGTNEQAINVLYAKQMS